jgi:uncharacterized membrane protein
MKESVMHERRPASEQFAVGLGWFSLGLGLTELVAPGVVARAIGLPPGRASAGTIRAMGLREVVSGVAVLSRPSAPAAMWSRVVGDAVDLALLSRTFGVPEVQRTRTALATAVVLGVSAADALVASRLRGRADENGGGAIEAAAAITIGRPIKDVYDFWRAYENFPRFMRNLDAVEDLGGGRSRWRVTGPAGVPVEWDAQIVSDQERHMISWRSLPGSSVENHGAVRFEQAPAGRGTEVHAEISYQPPAGELGHTAAWLFGRSPRQQMREGLRRVKQILELGEIPLSDGPGLSRAAQPSATPSSLSHLVGVKS